MRVDKIIWLYILLMLPCIGFSQPGKRWKLIWSDEFNYIDFPDSTKWGYETGFVRNQEQQYYTAKRPENCFVREGNLVITGRQETITNDKFKPGSSDWRYKDSLAFYTSASINTFGKFDLLYGRIDIRAKLPGGRGIWPAFWLLGINRPHVKWPSCGEIDIMEFIGDKDSTTIYGTVHRDNEGKTDPNYVSSGGRIKSKNITSDYHLYSLAWNRKYIDILFDNKKIFRYKIDKANRKNGDNAFRKPFYLLINLALGSAWPGPVKDECLPAELLVDYVRVYKLK